MRDIPRYLLPAIATDLGISVGAAGQLVTLYALGSVLAAIPLVKATQAWRRRPLLLMAIGGFCAVGGRRPSRRGVAAVVRGRVAALGRARVAGSRVAGDPRLGTRLKTGRPQAAANQLNFNPRKVP